MIDIFDILLPPIYLLTILFIAHKYKTIHEKEHIAFKYFMPGLIAKIIGAISLGLVYFYYYKGGDTFNYHTTAKTLVNLLYESPTDFFYVYFGNPTASEYYLMRPTGNFVFWVTDGYGYFVSKCFVPFEIIAGKSYMTTAILVASVCFISVWQLFMVFVKQFPNLSKQLSIPILFMPSVIFWGSGILKDSLTLSATCLYVYGFYWLIVQKKFDLKYWFAIIFSIYLLLSIKPYVFFALLPGSILWIVFIVMKLFKKGLMKLFGTPIIILIAIVVGYLVINNLESKLGQYSLDKVMETASVAQQDLKQSYYKGNAFDIGNYKPTFSGIASVSHKAIFASLFRPTLLDAKNIVMFFSAIENTVILFFCLILLYKLKIFGFFRMINANPLVLFSFIFSIFFALSVGLSISNFGTLVRLKIPCIPFFMASLVIIGEYAKTEKKNIT